MFMFSISPLLAGCITSHTLDAVNQPTTQTLSDRVSHIEKVVVSKDNQLLILLDGHLANSWQASRFTLVVPLAQIQTNAMIGLSSATNGVTFGILNVSRNAIHADWVLSKNSDDYEEAVPVGAQIPTPTEFRFNWYGWEVPQAFANSAKLLPNTTRTLYPIEEYRDLNGIERPTKIEFIYVDATARQAYTIIAVDQATITIKTHKGYYCLLPLTVPLDIATLPVQIPVGIYELTHFHE
jgi:hypothetical protein